MGVLDRLQHAWNAFFRKGPPYDTKDLLITPPRAYELGASSFDRPDRQYFTKGQERTFITTIYNRIAVDVSAADFRHVKLDKNGRFEDEIDSSLNDCLKVSGNMDQTGRALIQDIVQSMFDEGCVAVVPIDTDKDPEKGSFDIYSLRVGKITQWYPDKITVSAYNDRTGEHQEITVDKDSTAIIENPFYAIMNTPSSIAQRLIRKLNLLDSIDAQAGSGKLNLIIQLPYVIKTEARREQAAKRRDDIESQLAKSNYGIAYTDGTEKITQLNRPAENNMMNQVNYLTSMLLSQFGMTESILNGTADEKTMLNYKTRMIVPILRAISEEFDRKFITKTGRTQGQAIRYFMDPFQYVVASDMAEIADKFTRNEIMSSNEIRQIVGMKPSKDPKADELRNKNLNDPRDNDVSKSNSPVISKSAAKKEKTGG